MRRKGKAAFILAGLVIGVADGGRHHQLLDATTDDIAHKLEQDGPISGPFLGLQTFR